MLYVWGAFLLPKNNWISTKSCAHACCGALWGLCTLCCQAFKSFKYLCCEMKMMNCWMFFWFYHHVVILDEWWGIPCLLSSDYSMNCGPNRLCSKITFSHFKTQTPDKIFHLPALFFSSPNAACDGFVIFNQDVLCRGTQRCICLNDKAYVKVEL